MTLPAERKNSFKQMERFALMCLHRRFKTLKEVKQAAYCALRHYPSFGGGDFLYDELGRKSKVKSQRKAK